MFYCLGRLPDSCSFKLFTTTSHLRQFSEGLAPDIAREPKLKTLTPLRLVLYNYASSTLQTERYRQLNSSTLAPTRTPVNVVKQRARSGTCDRSVTSFRQWIHVRLSFWCSHPLNARKRQDVCWPGAAMKRIMTPRPLSAGATTTTPLPKTSVDDHHAPSAHHRCLQISTRTTRTNTSNKH